MTEVGDQGKGSGSAIDEYPRQGVRVVDLHGGKADKHQTCEEIQPAHGRGRVADPRLKATTERQIFDLAVCSVKKALWLKIRSSRNSMKKASSSSR